MVSRIRLLLICLVAFLAFSSSARSEIITNNFGLSSPDVTITFDEVVLPEGTVIYDQYSSYGVTFTPNLYYDSQGTPTGFPNIDGHYLGNFYTPTNQPLRSTFQIVFDAPTSEVAFAIVSNSQTTTFTALFDGGFVESFSVATDFTSTNNFYGFTGILFDTIQVDLVVSSPGTGLAAIDNLQFSSSNETVVPEPSSLALLGFGAIGAYCTLRRRRTNVFARTDQGHSPT